MPHLVIHYTANLDSATDMGVLCRSLADEILAQTDETGIRVFPPGGTRVFAYPATHFAVADGQHDCAFVYLNLRIAAGRSEALVKKTGDNLLMRVKAHFAPVFSARHIGITLQIDEGRELFDAKHSNIHPLFEP